MKALAKRVFDIEQSVAQRTKKMSDVDIRKMYTEVHELGELLEAG